MSIVDALSGPELAVYIRLLGAARKQKTRTVIAHNLALYREARTAARALRALEDMGLVTVRFDGKLQRTIEVHP